MSYMFAYATSFNQNLSRWSVFSDVTTSKMFFHANKFEQPLHWPAINTSGLFTAEQLTIDDWNKITRTPHTQKPNESLFSTLKNYFKTFKKPKSQDAPECGICMEDFKAEDDIIKACNNPYAPHYFHRGCLRKMKKMSNKHDMCPLCNKRGTLVNIETAPSVDFDKVDSDSNRI